MALKTDSNAPKTPSIRKEEISKTDSNTIVTNVSDLTHEQCSSIRRAERLGLYLQENCGKEIVYLYQNGATLTTIAEELGICTEYAVTKNVARSAICFALRGTAYYAGISEDAEQYAGLLEGDELDLLAEQHRKEGLKEGRRKGGALGGKTSYENKKGVHAMSHEELSEVGRQGAIARGQFPWFDSEIRQLVDIAASSEYQRNSGQYKGRPDLDLMAQSLNQTFHSGEPIRSANSVGKELRRLKKDTILRRTEEEQDVIVQKYVLWSDSETQQLINMTAMPEYQYDSHAHKGAPDLKLIAQSLNQTFHSGAQIRSAGSVRHKLDNLKKDVPLLGTEEDGVLESESEIPEISVSDIEGGVKITGITTEQLIPLLEDPAKTRKLAEALSQGE
jgi:hypothetical protein